MDKLPWHILLLEDNPDDCADMRQMLLRGGTRRYRFSEATLGAEGVRKVLAREDGPIDCLLLDYGLPDMDALEVLAALRNGADLPPCPVVVITGAAVEEGQALLSAGAQDFIGKRWTGAESLTRAVENAVDRYALQVERRRAEDALRASDDRYRALFNSIDAGYAVVQVLSGDNGAAGDVRYVQVNPAFERQSGMAGAEGRTLRALVPGIESTWLKVFESVALTGEPVRLEAHSAALQRWFDLYAFRLGEPSARQVAVLFTDTTERKNNERALMAAKAQADAASQAKSQFLLNMSHELRSPLSSILGFTQLIASGKPPPTPTQQDSVEQILNAGWFLLDLINEILDLSAIESGQMQLTSQALSIGDVLDDCRALIEPQAKRSGIQLGFDAPHQPVLVQADPVRTKQVLINLLTNAIKYNRPGGSVVVRCSAVAGHRVRVSVEDTGLGLTPTQQGQLFDPFNRLGQELGAVPGTGVGLVICKRLVDQMGGRMGVDSQAGVGSCFWFELAAAGPHPAGPREAPGRTVLCIEESAARLQEVEELMGSVPDTCLLRARDVPSGLELARAARPDLILLGLPRRDPRGEAAGQLLGRDPSIASIPVIAIGIDGPSQKPETGFADHLTLPLQREAFVEALDRALQRQPKLGQHTTA